MKIYDENDGVVSDGCDGLLDPFVVALSRSMTNDYALLLNMDINI